MKKDQGFKNTFIGILVMLLAWNGFLTYQVYDLNNRPTVTEKTEDGKTVEKVVTEFETDPTKVVENVRDQVVSVLNVQSGQLAGSGSGVVYKNEGGKIHIITNNHVTEKGEQYYVQFSNGEKVEAKLLGADPFTDLALLQVETDSDVKPMKLGDSSVVKVGEFVLAIGSPVDLEFANSVTFGVISGKDRKVPVDLNGDRNPDWDMVVMQTDAAINPGNSGGALVNMNGELIGINSMKLSSAQVEGMGFSIPINEVVPIIKQIEETGKVQYPVIGISGVSVSEMNPFLKNYYKVPSDVNAGVFIAELTQNGPARKADIKEGDILTHINDKAISSYREFRRELYAHKVGDTVKLTINRNGEIHEVEVTLQ